MFDFMFHNFQSYRRWRKGVWWKDSRYWFRCDNEEHERLFTSFAAKQIGMVTEDYRDRSA
jgi:hypothetical protein